MRRCCILYRGRLASCSYDCAYCPFAKRRDTRDTLRRERGRSRALRRLGRRRARTARDPVHAVG